MKLKLSKRTITAVVVAGIAVLALVVSRKGGDAGGPEAIDAPAHQACADFAAGYPKAKSKALRLSLADKVTANSSRSENNVIRKRAAEMGAAAGDGAAKWKTAADALTSACKTG
ncbi:hypothetical protein [Actinoplanes sp. NPDC026619]|uniref:hypothetical protein n=1 Tax=Actinoplanes sp. NPDC026619 TaxID=3155798 RepID=UPI0033CF4C7D